MEQNYLLKSFESLPESIAINIPNNSLSLSLFYNSDTLSHSVGVYLGVHEGYESAYMRACVTCTMRARMQLSDRFFNLIETGNII